VKAQLEELLRVHGEPSARTSCSKESRHGIPSMSQGRLGTAACTLERATTAQRTSSTGQQTTEPQVEQADPGDPGSGPRVTTPTTGTVRPGPSGAQATRTIQARDANGSYGSFGVVSVDTTKSDNIHAIQVQIATSEKPK
jgi:hypothetical protein